MLTLYPSSYTMVTWVMEPNSSSFLEANLKSPFCFTTFCRTTFRIRKIMTKQLIKYSMNMNWQCICANMYCNKGSDYYENNMSLSQLSTQIICMNSSYSTNHIVEGFSYHIQYRFSCLNEGLPLFSEDVFSFLHPYLTS